MNIKHYVLLLIAVNLVSVIFGQNTINSPYTHIGLGETGTTENSMLVGLGSKNPAVADSATLNCSNPASLTYLSTGQPLYGIGLTTRFSNFTGSEINAFRPAAYVDQFGIGFGFRNRMGLAFGLTPYARKGYTMYDKTYSGLDSVYYTYKGSGTISKAFLSVALAPIHTSRTHVSIGFEGGWLFGTTKNTRISQLTGYSATLGGIDHLDYTVNALHYNLGLNIQQRIAKNQFLQLGLALQPRQHLSAVQDQRLTYGLVAKENFNTIIDEVLNVQGTVYTGLSYQTGLSYKVQFKSQRKNNSLRSSQLGLILGYDAQQQEQNQSTFDSTLSLLNTQRFAAGIEYIPESQFQQNGSTLATWERVRYRLGVYHYTLPYVLTSGTVTDRGLTLGLSLPLIAQQSMASLNLGVSYGNRTAQIAGVSETYAGLQVGIVFAPAPFERWFKKRKLD